jgi:hypothetical protein
MTQIPHKTLLIAQFSTSQRGKTAVFHKSGLWQAHVEVDERLV